MLILIIGICAEIGKQIHVVVAEPLQQLVEKQSQSVDEMKQVFQSCARVETTSSRKGKQKTPIRKLQQCFQNRTVDKSKYVVVITWNS